MLRSDIKERNVLDLVERERGAIVGLLRELVRAQSVNPPGDTARACEVIAAATADCGLRWQSIAVEGRTSLIGTLGGEGPELLFNSHTDTVPVGDLHNWSVPPMQGLLRDGYVYGRGAADAKGAVTAQVMAARCLALAGAPLAGRLVVTAVADEETGGALGTGYLLRHGYLNPKWAVIGEITGNAVAIAHKGISWFKITTYGTTAHASTPWEGVNAIDKMVTFLHRLRRTLGEALRRRTHPLTPPPTISLGLIKGGVKENVVADRCEVVIDRRMLPSETLESAQAELEAVLDELRTEDPDFRASMELLQYGEPLETPPNHPFVRIACGACRDLGLDPRPVGYRQASDGRFFASAGIPTILIGPGVAEEAHRPDEKLAVEDLVTATKLYVLLALRMLAPGGGEVGSGGVN